ncbi:LytR/AlgR family response regulator transcription factor [Gelidibacter salicanalis]|nr:LytTR family DNA-binding domain-containing protein [Gelidibacter salicanalis]
MKDQMKIKCIIIDDEALAISVIENHLKDFDYIEIVETFTNPLNAYRILEKEKIDLIFLDINMPQLTGFAFIENLNYRPLIVITTAYREYAVKSFELNILDYLVKPIPFDRFLKTINKVYQHVYQNTSKVDANLQQEPHIFLRVNKKLIKTNLNDILYIESLKDYIKVITVLGDYVVHKSLTAITEELPQFNFMRIHRSYTVSINKINALEGNNVEISNRKIPIGRNYSKQAKERIFNINDEDED